MCVYYVDVRFDLQQFVVSICQWRQKVIVKLSICPQFISFYLLVRRGVCGGVDMVI